METTNTAEMKIALAEIEAKIAKIDGLSDPYLDGIQKAFPLGTVGASGKNTAALNKRREASIDKAIVTARLRNTLQAEADRLKTQIANIEGGVFAQREAKAAAAAERVRNVTVGSVVFDSSYGNVKVVRVNAKTLTIETSSGYREARPYSLIWDVVLQKPANA